MVRTVRQSGRQPVGGGASVARSALRADSPAMLAHPARGRTRCAACGSSAQTTAASQITKQACPSAGLRPDALRFSAPHRRTPRYPPPPGPELRLGASPRLDRSASKRPLFALQTSRRSRSITTACVLFRAARRRCSALPRCAAASRLHLWRRQDASSVTPPAEPKVTVNVGKAAHAGNLVRNAPAREDRPAAGDL